MSGVYTTYSLFLGQLQHVDLEAAQHERAEDVVQLADDALAALRLVQQATSWPSSPLSTSSKSNQRSNLLSESKMLGRRKLSSDHSSRRSFCSGVPVSRRRFSLGYSLSRASRRHLMFFSRCPSSTTSSFHW